MRRRVIVIVAAVVPVVALVVAIAIGRGGSSSPPAKLPVAYGSGGTGGTSARAAALDAATPAIYPYAPARYVAASDLPDLGGAAHAYRVDGAVTDAAMSALVRALGVDASSVTVQRASGQWTVAGVASDIAVASPCFAEPPTPDGTVVEPNCPPTTTTTPPPPSLSEADARARATDVARASGVDVDAAAIAAQLQGNQWYVTIDPTVDGLPTSGLGTSVAFAADGGVAYASGYLANVDKADEYPLLTTRQAIEQLNANQVVPEVALAPAPSPDGTPTTPVPPRDITVTAATSALLYQPSYDGQSGYLVPAYRFTTDDGQTPTALALDRSWFAPPPVDTLPADSTSPKSADGSPGSVGGGSAGTGTGSANPGSEVPPAASAEPPVPATSSP